MTTGADGDRPVGSHRRRRASWPVLLGVAAGYLVVSVGLWWGVWSSHPSATTTCGCGDAARFLWFFEWPAFALSHGHSVLYSSYLFHPTGINLLDDTSVLALGIVLAPVTWAFGPVASMNVALTLAPALSAFAMFVLLRRWVTWTPAAVLGGLAYGFSPFLITELALNQLNIAFLAVPPLLIMALDDLLVRQPRPPWRTGLVLAALAVVQFFVSTEVLLIGFIATAVGVVLLVGSAALRRPGAVGARAGHALRGAAVALGATVAVLAYPLWFLLRGPAHLSGPIWSNGAVDRFGTTPASFVTTGGLGPLRSEMLHFGGYQGATLVGLGYLGTGVLVVVVLGTVAFRHDHHLLLFGGVGLVAAVLSFGPGHGAWVPWDAIDRLPWIGDIVEVRFVLVISLCAAVMLAVVLDRTRGWVDSGRVATRWPAAVRAGAPWVLAAALLPSLVALWPDLPLTTRAVVLPRWYAEVGARLPPGQVVLAYPAPFSGLQSSQAWQAVNRMRWAQAGGGGPEGQADRAGAARAGFEVLAAASLGLGSAPEPTPAALAAIRHALAVWRVTLIVVPDQPGLPGYDHGRSTAYAVGLFTAATGRPPVYDHQAWVWSSGTTGAPVPLSDPAFTTCTSGAVAADPARLAVPDCVLGSPR